MGKKMAVGVLSSNQLKKAVSRRIIASKGTAITDEQIQPASMDLRLGPVAYRLVSSFLPEDRGVEDRLLSKGQYGTDLVMYEIDISGGGILEKGHVYLIPLLEELSLPDGVKGRANPKSTTGRLDIFARVLTDRCPRFDDVAEGYKGRLYLEVMPRSFAIKVEEGLSLVQLRLMAGDCTLDDRELKSLHKKTRILYDGDAHISDSAVNISRGLFMSVDLSGSAGGGIIGYKSKRNSHVVDLTKKNHYNIDDFWETIYSGKGTLILEPEDFYILCSKEKIRIPPGYAAEMVPYEAGSGELRTHYAGFFDPGFGFGSDGEVKGTKAVLEVRAHDVPFMIADGQTFCKLFFEEMMEVPKKVYGPKIGSSYQFQGITLSKQFKNY